jgi:MFS family permease
MDTPSGSKPIPDSVLSTSVKLAGTTPAGYFRWVICALLLFGTTKNYMDRQVIGVLKTTLQHDLGWNEIDYGNLVFAFQTAYAVGMLLVGRMIDRLGTRLGYALAMLAWSLASMAHGIAHSFAGFLAARSALGFGEAGVFPASLKATAEWFPRKERALATGVFNAGTNIGALITPLIVPWITVHWGWRWVLFGSLSGFGFIAGRRTTRIVLPPNCNTSTVIRTKAGARFPGPSFCRIGKPGRLPRGNSSSTPSGGSIYFGFRTFFSAGMDWPCCKSARPSL